MKTNACNAYSNSRIMIHTPKGLCVCDSLQYSMEISMSLRNVSLWKKRTVFRNNQSQHLYHKEIMYPRYHFGTWSSEKWWRYFHASMTANDLKLNNSHHTWYIVFLSSTYQTKQWKACFVGRHRERNSEIMTAKNTDYKDHWSSHIRRIRVRSFSKRKKETSNVAHTVSYTLHFVAKGSFTFI